MTYDAFYPGALWLDTNGKPIQAHGGSVIFDGGRYYWYGENKEFTDGKSGIWHWGGTVLQLHRPLQLAR